MFENIGGKIKILAKFICLAGVVVSLLEAGSIWVNGSNISLFANNYRLPQTGSILSGVFVLVVGSLCSWIGTWFIYAFGDLVEHVAAIWYMMMEMRRENKQ